MSLRHYAFVILVGAIVTFITTPLVRAYAMRRGLVDRPGGRKVHTSPIPRLGGVAIFLGVMAGLAAQVIGERYFGWGGMLTSDGTVPARVIGAVAALGVIFLVGLIDDLFTLTPGVKFGGQTVAALIAVASGLRIDYIGNPFGGGLMALGLLSIPITLVYILGFTNVINLIDGLDGLAAGVSAIAATGLLILAAQGNRLDAAALAAAVIGACVAFLRYNFNPASIFMGDSGALFLGFALAVISLLGVMKSTAAIALAVPLLIIGVPIFDTASAIIRRVRHQRPIQEADKGHIHHRLLGRGFDQRQTVLVIYVWCVVLGVGAYAVRWAAGPVKIVAFALLFAVTGFMTYWLGLFEAAGHPDDDSSHSDAAGSRRTASK